MNDLDEHFSRLNGIEDILASRLFTDMVQKVFYNTVVNICLKECKPHFLQHILHVGIGQFSLADDIPHGFIQTVT